MTVVQELKRRKVVRTTIAYLAGAFVAAQGTQLLVDGLGLPGWLFKAVLLALLVALPFVIGLAWTFDFTAEGIALTRKDPAQSVIVLRWRRVAVPGTVAVLMVLASLGFLSWQRSTAPGPRAGVGRPDARHVAVLYFRAIRGDSLAPLADGLTEGLIRELTRGTTLHVVSPNGVLPFRNTSALPDSIARALEVGTLVDGSVAAVGDNLRLNVSLVDASNAQLMGTASFEVPSASALALQDSLLSGVALFLRERLGENLALLDDRGRTKSAAAWRLYLEARALERGIGMLLSAGDTAAARRELLKADTALQQAAALDRDWSAPLVERARLAYRALDLSGTPDRRQYDEWTSRGLEHLTVPLSKQPDDADALALRGMLRYYRSVFNLGATPHEVLALGDSAESDFRAAVASNPQQADAWSFLSHRLMRKNQTAEGKLAALRAYEADPYASGISTILVRLFMASLDLEDREEAARWCAEGLRRFPDDGLMVECQILVHVLPGQQPNVPEIWRALEHYVGLWPPGTREFRRRRGELFAAMALARANLPDSARAVALRARTDATIDPSRDLVYVEMLLRNVLGDRSEALSLAAQYYAANPQERIDCRPGSNNLDRTWWLRGLVDDPHYLALVCTRR
jgi:TolB-like protein